MQVQALSAKQVLVWQQQYELLYGSAEIPRILRHGRLLYKFLWRNDSLITQDRLWPAAQRFCKNSQRLKAVAVLAPEVENLYYCRKLRLFIATYQQIDGKDLRELAGTDDAVLEQFAHYLYQLHQQGVFFRGLHLGNVIQTPQAKMGLIDIGDLRLFPMALPTAIRLRNLKHLFNNTDDKNLWRSYGLERFLQHYCSNSNRHDPQKLLQALEKKLKP